MAADLYSMDIVCRLSVSDACKDKDEHTVWVLRSFCTTVLLYAKRVVAVTLQNRIIDL
jgi:hypothetical protein